MSAPLSPAMLRALHTFRTDGALRFLMATEGRTINALRRRGLVAFNDHRSMWHLTAAGLEAIREHEDGAA